MSNQVEICNAALSRVNAGKINSIDDATREARTCKLHYEMDRDAVLRDLDWKFARKQVAIAQLSETVTGWTYVYRYPSDCIIAREIYNSAKSNDEDLIDFEVGLGSTGDYQVILTNQSAAELIYTAKVTNPAVYDALFVNAFCWCLAADLAVPLRADPQLAQSCLQAYQKAIGSAKAATLNEHSKLPIESSSFFRARQ